MVDSILRAWAACADEDFGGSLDDLPDEPPAVKLRLARALPAAQSGVPFLYRHQRGWQFRPPGRYGLPTRMFGLDKLDEARAYVRALLETKP